MVSVLHVVSVAVLAVLGHTYLWWCTAICYEPLIPCGTAEEGAGVDAGDVVLITGVGQDLGGEVAMLYARRGAHIILTADSETSLLAVAKRCETAGAASTTAVVGDVRSLSRSGKLLEKAQMQFGRIDLLFLCHAEVPDELFQEPKTLASFESALESNYLASVRLIHQALPLLSENFAKVGKIGRVAIAGNAGSFFYPAFRSAYTSSAAGLASFSATLRMELELIGRPEAPSVTHLHFGEVGKPVPPVPAHARALSPAPPPWWTILPADAAAVAVRAVDRRISEAYVPSWLWMMSWFNNLPAPLRSPAYYLSYMWDRPLLIHRVNTLQRIFPNRVERVEDRASHVISGASRDSARTP